MRRNALIRIRHGERAAGSEGQHWILPPRRLDRRGVRANEEGAVTAATARRRAYHREARDRGAPAWGQEGRYSGPALLPHGPQPPEARSASLRSVVSWPPLDGHLETGVECADQGDPRSRTFCRPRFSRPLLRFFNTFGARPVDNPVGDVDKWSELSWVVPLRLVSGQWIGEEEVHVEQVGPRRSGHHQIAQLSEEGVRIVRLEE